MIPPITPLILAMQSTKSRKHDEIHSAKIFLPTEVFTSGATSMPGLLGEAYERACKEESENGQ